MGASPFYETSWIPDLDEAFDEAHAQACHLEGRGGYSGSLAEKNSVIAIRDAGVLPFDEARKFAEELILKDDARIGDKWGPAGAIPITLSEAQRREISVTARAALTDENVDGRGVSKMHLDRLVEGELRAVAEQRCRANEQVFTVALDELDVRTRIVRAPAPAKTKLVYRVGHEFFATKGDAVKRQRVILAARQQEIRKMVGKEALRQFSSQAFDPVTVEAVKVTDTGDRALASGHLEVASFAAKATVTLTESSANARVDGWLLFGMASQ